MTEPITSAVILGIVTYRAGKIAGNVAEDFLKRALAPVGDAAGKVLAYPIEEWQKAREKRGVEIVEAAARHLDAADVEAVAVPGRTLFPLLQSASLEEHPDLRRMFAILLANAAHPQKQADLLPSFVSILSQLAPVEAVILERVYLDSLDGQDRIAYSPSGTLENVAKMRLVSKATDGSYEDIAIPADNYMVLFDNLARQGLVEEVFAGSTRAGMSISNKTYGPLNLTPLGKHFVASCVTPPVKD